MKKFTAVLGIVWTVLIIFVGILAYHEGGWMKFAGIALSMPVFILICLGFLVMDYFSIRSAWKAKPKPPAHNAGDTAPIQAASAEAAAPVAATTLPSSNPGAGVPCPKCGVENGPFDQFCYNCGASLTKPNVKRANPRIALLITGLVLGLVVIAVPVSGIVLMDSHGEVATPEPTRRSKATPTIAPAATGTPRLATTAVLAATEAPKVAPTYTPAMSAGVQAGETTPSPSPTPKRTAAPYNPPPTDTADPNNDPPPVAPPADDLAAKKAELLQRIHTLSAKIGASSQVLADKIINGEDTPENYLALEANNNIIGDLIWMETSVDYAETLDDLAIVISKLDEYEPLY